MLSNVVCLLEPRLLIASIGEASSFASCHQSGNDIETFAAGKSAAYKVFQVIDRVPSIDTMSEGGDKPTKVVGRIELKGVDFTYPARDDIKVGRFSPSSMLAPVFALRSVV